MNNNKFYTLETEQRNRFYQVPKQFMNKQSKYFNLKPDTKLIYGVLSDRNSLSIKSGWYDEEGRIYFKFNQKELAELFGMTPKTLRTRLEELESNGLLYRKRLGFKQADNLYLLQLDYEEFEKETNVNDNVGSTENTMMGKNYSSRKVKTTHHDREKLPTNDTNINKTNNNKTNITTTRDNNKIIENNIKDSSSQEENENNSKLEKSNSTDIDLNIKAITKCNIKKLRLNQEQIELLEEYVKLSKYVDIDKFSYYIAKSIKQQQITIKDLLNINSSNNATKQPSNQKIKNFREKNYDYDALERELLGWDD